MKGRDEPRNLAENEPRNRQERALEIIPMLTPSLCPSDAEILKTGVSFFRLQVDPEVVVMLALGLAGTEESPYCIDILAKLPPTWTIVTIRGYECCHGGENDKFFMKNDTTRVKSVFWSLKHLLS